MAKTRCPRCQFVMDRPSRGLPICPKCGYGAQAAGVQGMAPVRSVYGDRRSEGRMARPLGRGGKVTSPFGRPRDEATVMLLVGLTLTLYGLYVWPVTVFKELRRLHGKSYPWVRYTVGIVFPPVLLAHLFLEVGESEYYRYERRLEGGMRLGRFMALWVAGAAVLALVGGLWVLQVVPWEVGVGLFAAAVLLFIEIHMYAYAQAQRAVNEIWYSQGVTA